jgi:hypothetical protein
MRSKAERDEARSNSNAIVAGLLFLLSGQDPWQTISDARGENRLREQFILG